MAKVISNFPFQGVDYDTSPQLVKNDRMTDAHNVRITGTEGQDYLAEVVPGTARDIANGLGFDLSVDGATGSKYVEIASASIKGIVFVASWNPTIGAGELGSFPSVNPVTRVFERVYRPLNNYLVGQNPHNLVYQLETGAITQAALDAFRLPMRTTNLQFQLTKATEMVVREDYDGSVNIYLFDGVNPDRVFNSGFNINDASYNNRMYNIDSFEQVIRLYNETLSPCDVTMAAINEKGKLKCGNYFLHFRYTDESFNKTSFHTKLGPIPIALSSLKEPFACRGGLPSAVSNKSILINIDTTTLDDSYKFMEIAVCRFTNDQTGEVNIVDKQWNIQEMLLQNPFQIEITGYENYRISTPEELTTRKRTDEICESAVDFESRLFRGNTFEDNIDYNELLAFSKTIELNDFTETANLYNSKEGKGLGYSAGNCGYKDPALVLLKTGYFGSETYPFGVIYLLKSGKLTPAFPIKGHDRVQEILQGISIPNTLGLYRFPKRNAFGNEDVVDILGVNATIPFSSASLWIQQNVVGAYIVRGERIKNLQFQGLMTYAFDSQTLLEDGMFYSDSNGSDWAYETWSRDRVDHATKKCAPFVWYEYRAYDRGNEANGAGQTQATGNVAQLPWVWNVGNGKGQSDPSSHCTDPGSDDGTQTDWCRSPAGNYFIARVVPYYYGIFSPDYCFSQKLVDRTYFIQTIGAYTEYPKWNPNEPNYSMFYYFLDHKKTTPGAPNKFNADAYGILQWQAPDKNNFVSYFAEGSGEVYDDDGDIDVDAGSKPKEEFHFFYHYSQFRSDRKHTQLKNLAMGLPPYIGVQIYPNQTGSLAASLKMVNLYSVNPDDISDISVGYNFSSNRFYRITKLLRYTGADIVQKVFHGDCFINRTYIKTLGNPQYDVDKKEDNTSGEPGRGNNYFTFGFVTGIVAESAYNCDYRATPDYNTATSQDPIKDAIQAFWPGIKPENAEYFSTRMRSKEAFTFNTGYNRTLDLLSFAGFDIVLPLQKFHYPKRVNFSNKYISGSFIDSFRVSGLADHKDFEDRLGEIVAMRRTNHSLFSVHVNGIIRHSVEERAFQTNEQGRIEIGSQAEVLHPRGNIMTDDFGAQHKTASFATDNALYVLDWQKRKILISGQDFQQLSDIKMVNTKVYNFIDAIEHRSDVMNPFIAKQVPATGEGIRIGFNRKFKEVHFAILAQSGSMDLVFNEKVKVFSGTRDEASPTYILINEDFFSCDPASKNNFHLHDIPVLFGNDNYLRFYGNNPSDAYWEFSVNAGSEMKVFLNIQINSNDQPFKKIVYRSEFMEATHDPFTNNPEIYIEPVYKEGLWRLAVKRADTILGSHYATDTFGPGGVGTEMREKYLKVKIYYGQTTSAFLKRQYIKSLQTFVIETNS